MNRRDDMWIDCEYEKTIGTDECEDDRIESVKCEREGVRKHSFFVCKIVCWKSMWETARKLWRWLKWEQK